MTTNSSRLTWKQMMETTRRASVRANEFREKHPIATGEEASGENSSDDSEK